MPNSLSARVRTYVDMSNLVIEGKRISAVRTGLASSIEVAQRDGILDNLWRLDLGAFRSLLDRCQPRGVARILAFGSKTHREDRFWQAVARCGMRPLAASRHVGRPEKGVDVQLTVDVMTDLFLHLAPGDEACLVSGDSDFAPLLRTLRSRGVSTRVIFWEHAARALRNEASSFVSLDPYFTELSLNLPMAA